ncbi:hypothetical protein ZHAS_00014229 [Anopheles sinensis]|uniref:Uncharacterized protein n=1 Tax=Anopheles sinensis TaxID=74873 RepID=A0A084W7M9_ANOSI|nr:hypothetical protein ZHAS_00014229 [Anopheles sinensis]
MQLMVASFSQTTTPGNYALSCRSSHRITLLSPTAETERVHTAGQPGASNALSDDVYADKQHPPRAWRRAHWCTPHQFVFGILG